MRLSPITTQSGDLQTGDSRSAFPFNGGLSIEHDLPGTLENRGEFKNDNPAA